MMPSGVTGTSGTGAAGMMTGAAGTGMTGVAGMTGAAGMAAPAGSGAAGTAVAGMGAGGMGAPMFTPGSPTFTAIYQEIIVAKGCNGGPTCHAGLAAGQLKMTSQTEAFMSLVGVKAMGVNLVMGSAPNCKDTTLTRVVAGNPDMSLLYKKVASAMPECGGKMPPTAMLPQPMIDQIKMWIMNGAKND
jgi:hypothetical protein